MSKIIFPKFKSGDLLTNDLLNHLRDNPIDLISGIYSDFSDGIISGLDIDVLENSKKFSISKGVFKLKDKLYWLKEKEIIDFPKNEGHYSLIILIINEKNEITLKIKYLEDIIEKENSIELCSFILREGSNIKKMSLNYNEYEEEFNTIELINVIYSYPFEKKGTIHPYITKKWGELSLDKFGLTYYDYTFANLCTNSLVSRTNLIKYINKKLNKTSLNYTNKEIYKDLLYILNNIFKEFEEKQKKVKENKIEKIRID